MQTLEEQFNTRLNAFLGSTGLRPTTLGMQAVGDPSLLRQLERGRSPSLRTADRILAFMTAYEQDSGGARAPPGRLAGPGPATRGRKANRSRAMSEQPIEQRTNPPTRFLRRLGGRRPCTGLSRSTIYDWCGCARGSFPKPLSAGRSVRSRWIEEEVDEWIRDDRIVAEPGRRSLE